MTHTPGGVDQELGEAVPGGPGVQGALCCHREGLALRVAELGLDSPHSHALVAPYFLCLGFLPFKNKTAPRPSGLCDTE